jgi:hypothetical protein
MLGSRSLTQSIVVLVVLTAMLAGLVMFASAQRTIPTNPTVPISPEPGDTRVCGNFPGGFAQTAAIYRTGTINNSNLLIYEINDNGVGTYRDEVPRATIIELSDLAEETDEEQVLFSQPDSTVTVVVLPSGICEYRSIHIPTAQNKPFVCRFVCN